MVICISEKQDGALNRPIGKAQTNRLKYSNVYYLRFLVDLQPKNFIINLFSVFARAVNLKL